MRMFRFTRWLLLALFLCLVPATSRAGVFISVGFAPPDLPAYEQPLCPESGLMWMPGYWAYGDDGYYWVPGAWVPAPYEGALWTPGYWGWSDNLYVFHDGYWGDHVGYYGGVNYGFGYMGIGFAGGEWRGHDFAYNTAVVRVNTTIIHNTYVNETIVHNNTVVNNSRVAFSGGKGGIQHQPTAQEQQAMHETHVPPTTYQQQHVQTARTDRTLYAKANGGHPQTLAVAKPLAAETHPAPSGMRPSAPAAANPNGRPGSQPQPGARPETRPAPPLNSQARPEPSNPQQNRPAPAMPNNDARPQPHPTPSAPQQPRY